MISNSENLSNSYESLNSSLRPKEWNVCVSQLQLKYKKIKSEEAFSSSLARNVVAMWKYKMSVQRQC